MFYFRQDFSIKIFKTMTFIVIMSICSSLSAAPQLCSELLTKPQQNSKPQDLKSFGYEMTTGLLLHPNQWDLFEIYLKVFFGDPNTAVGLNTLKTLNNLLLPYPELTKPHFQEYKINSIQKQYPIPESLTKYLKSQNTIAGEIRSNLFQIEANKGYWKRLFDSTAMNDSLDSIFSKEIRDRLADKNVDYKLKIKILFNELIKKNSVFSNNPLIKQTIVDLVATTGFNNPVTQALLKSKNPFDKIDGLKKILVERDSMAMELGFKGGFSQLLNQMNITKTTLSETAKNELQWIELLRQDILKEPISLTLNKSTRIRSLSLQESAFRSYLGAQDCSSVTYFSKALDPNFIYFTATDSENHSSGHLTLVLGTAKDISASDGQVYKIAFVDKIQNISNTFLTHFLKAVSLSLAEKGYLLGIPQSVGDETGISNSPITRFYVENEILPKFTTRASLYNFTPIPHNYDFKNKFSRAYLKMPIRVFNLSQLPQDVEIQRGQTYQTHWADPNLNKNNLINELIRLRHSTHEQDILSYILSFKTIEQLEKLELFSQKEYLDDLQKIAKSLNFSFNLRKHALYQIIFAKNKTNEKQILPEFKDYQFSPSEEIQISSEIKQWQKSSDIRKSAYADGITHKWFESAKQGNESLADQLLALKFVDINQKNDFGHTALMIATQNRQIYFIQKLLSYPELNIFDSDSKGFMAIDHAYALGHEDIAELLKKHQPYSNRNSNHRVHRPIEFIKIEGGSFEMGDSKVAATLTPFEMMSTLVTQNMYLKIMGENPSFFKDGENTNIMNISNKLHKIQPDNPIEMINYEESETFIQRINSLSKLNSDLIYDIIPDHRQGAQYDFITEAQLEFAIKKAKTEDGDNIDSMIHRNDIEAINQVAVYLKNSKKTTWPVGQKKPLFIFGQPIYDLVGNVKIWTKDWYHHKLVGGINPQGPLSGINHAVRGGGWSGDLFTLASSFRYDYSATYRYDSLGLRLVRIVK